jgi:hypothetical protein
MLSIIVICNNPSEDRYNQLFSEPGNKKQLEKIFLTSPQKYNCSKIFEKHPSGSEGEKIFKEQL